MTQAGIQGIYPQTITKIEAGTRQLKFSEGMALASVLQTSAYNLIRPDRVDERAAMLSAAVDALRKHRRVVEDATADYLEAAARVFEQAGLAAIAGVPEQTVQIAVKKAQEPLDELGIRGQARFVTRELLSEINMGLKWVALSPVLSIPEIISKRLPPEARHQPGVWPSPPRGSDDG